MRQKPLDRHANEKNSSKEPCPGRSMSWRYRMIMGVGLVTILVCYVVALRAPAVGMFHDDGVYLVTAKALAAGEGYRLISLPTEIPQTKYPFMLPFLLALVWSIYGSFPANLVLLKLIPFCASVVWFLFAFFFIEREAKSKKLAIGITILTTLSPWVLFYSSTLLSETLFAALIWAGLILLRTCEAKDATAKNTLLAALACSAAFYTRTIGFTLILAGFLALLYRRRVRTGLAFGLSCAALIAPWIIWSTGWKGPEMYDYYAGANYHDWNILFRFAWEEKLRIVAWNLLYIVLAPGWLLGVMEDQWWAMIGMLIGGIVTASGFVISAKRDVNVTHIFVSLYLLVLLLWAWPPLRFLAPIYPLLILYAAWGMEPLVKRSEGRWATCAIAIVLSIVFLQAGWALGSAAWRSINFGVVCPSRDCPEWSSFERLNAFLQTGVPQDAILMGNLDPLLYLYTGRKSVRAFEEDPYALFYSKANSGKRPLGPPARLLQRLSQSGAHYLVAMPSESDQAHALREQIAELRRLYPGVLEALPAGCDATYCVYRVRRERLEKAIGRLNPG